MPRTCARILRGAHKIDACPNTGTAIEHVAAVNARKLEEEDEDDDCEQDSVAPQPRQPHAAGLGAVRRATRNEQVGDILCGVHAAPAATSMTAFALVTFALSLSSAAPPSPFWAFLSFGQRACGMVVSTMVVYPAPLPSPRCATRRRCDTSVF